MWGRAWIRPLKCWDAYPREPVGNFEVPDRFVFFRYFQDILPDRAENFRAPSMVQSFLNLQYLGHLTTLGTPMGPISAISHLNLSILGKYAIW